MVGWILALIAPCGLFGVVRYGLPLSLIPVITGGHSYAFRLLVKDSGNVAPCCACRLMILDQDVSRCDKPYCGHMVCRRCETTPDSDWVICPCGHDDSNDGGSDNAEVSILVLDYDLDDIEQKDGREGGTVAHTGFRQDPERGVREYSVGTSRKGRFHSCRCCRCRCRSG